MIYAIIGYFLWGILPLYWNSIHDVDALQMLLHRVSWSFVFMLFINLIKSNLKPLWLKARNKENLKFSIVGAVLLTTNWFFYVWSVTSGYIVEASLGYFINPLFSVMLGVLFLKERLRKFQIISIIIAFSGVCYLTIALGKLPWISLILAFSFGLYGLCKKKTRLNSTEGLTLETGFLFIPVLVGLVVLEIKGIGAFGHVDLKSNLLLSGAGAATALPLIFFAAGARRISLSFLGMLQYIAPTLQFLIGVFVYEEAFPMQKFIGYAVVWIALILYTVESMIYYNGRKKNRL